MKIKIFISLIFVEIIIILFLGFKIYHKKNVLGEISINPIKKENLILLKENKLKYFYEPEKSYTSEGVYYHINNDRLRELKNYSTEKPQGTFRIITLVTLLLMDI